MRSYRSIDLLEDLETLGTFITGFSIVDHNNRRLTISIIVAVDDEGLRPLLRQYLTLLAYRVTRWGHIYGLLLALRLASFIGLLSWLRLMLV